MPKRARSKTPEVQWESLPDAVPSQPVTTRPRGSTAASAKVPVPPAEKKAPPEDSGVSAEEARESERKAWRALVVILARLRGDPKVESLLTEKHPELLRSAEICGAAGAASVSLAQAKEDARSWFERGLRGSNRQGPAGRAALINKLYDTLQSHMAGLRKSIERSKLGELLEKGKPDEEGPVICTMLSDELVGSKYEDLWISRESRGFYILGDSHEGSGLPNRDQIGATINPRVRAAVKFTNGRLVIDAFYHDGEDTPVPARVPIGPFLSVYFEGMPLKEALAQWSRAKPTGVIGTNGGVSAATKSADDSMKALREDLPPGWELRESRSKKGVYYYANVAKGLSQLERPKA